MFSGESKEELLEELLPKFDDTDIILPGTLSKDKTENELKTDVIDFGSGDSEKQVTNVIVREQEEIWMPNFVIDLREATKTMEFNLEAIGQLTRDDEIVSTRYEDETPDTSLYLWVDGGIIYIGQANSIMLYRILGRACKKIFGKNTKVYKDYELGKAYKEMSDIEANDYIIMDI